MDMVETSKQKKSASSLVDFPTELLEMIAIGCAYSLRGSNIHPAASLASVCKRFKGVLDDSPCTSAEAIHRSIDDTLQKTSLPMVRRLQEERCRKSAMIKMIKKGCRTGLKWMVSHAFNGGAIVDLIHSWPRNYSRLGPWNYSDPDLFIILLDAAAAPHTSCLSIASARGHVHVVRSLLMAGAAVDKADLGLALFHACDSAHVPIVRMLIDAGADVNKKDGPWTPIMYAAYAAELASTTRGTQCIRLLIDAGADVDMVVDDDGETPLMFAASVINSPNMLLNLIAAGANLELRDNLSRTALMRASSNVTNGGCSCVEILLAAGADKHKVDVDGNTALALALRSQNAAAIRLLEQE